MGNCNKIKFSKGFNNFLELIDQNGFEILPFSYEHALVVSSLEFHHRDPFDRLIIAQAMVEDLTILTKDEQINQYEVPVFW